MRLGSLCNVGTQTIQLNGLTALFALISKYPISTTSALIRELCNTTETANTSLAYSPVLRNKNLKISTKFCPDFTLFYWGSGSREKLLLKFLKQKSWFCRSQ